MKFIFYGCINLSDIKVSFLDNSKVQNNIKMFNNCVNLAKKYLPYFNLKI